MIDLQYPPYDAEYSADGRILYFTRLYTPNLDGPDQEIPGSLETFDTATNSRLERLEVGLSPHEVISIAYAESADADFNRDLVVDFSDFLLFASAFGSRVGSPGWDDTYDLDGSNAVDFRDFLEFVQSFGLRYD